MKIRNRKNGQAIILVLSILGIVSLIGFSFLSMSQMELKGATSYLARLQTKYLAEAGINYAKEVLTFDKEANNVDSYDELWNITFAGTDVDLSGDGSPDSKWFYVKDSQGNDIGRYAILVRDEAGKVNVNGDEAVLSKFFSSSGFGGETTVRKIIDYRYGEDKKPGAANTDDNGNNSSLERDLLDNDGDGSVDENNEGIDESEEFNVENPKGDDRPFVVIDELKKLKFLSSEDFKNTEKFLTVSSKDQEKNTEGGMRQNINYMKAEDILKIMLERGVSEPWQKSVNIVDSLDINFARATIYKHYNLLQTRPGQVIGSWAWNNSYYQCDIPGSQGSWSWNNLKFPDGEYYCYIYGLEDEPIGDVEIQGIVQQHMHSGDAFIKSEGRKVTIQGGSFSLSIQNNEEFGKMCYFARIELIPEDINSGSALLSKEIHGVEPIRINELMVAPKIARTTTSSNVPGGAWVWHGSLFINSDSESGTVGEGTWVFVNIPNGYYYLRLFGQEGKFIGDVEVNGRTQVSMRDGDYFTETKSVQVTSNQLVIRIQNNLKDKTCYFKSIVLSQQPDTEYVELVNISKNTVDLSGWSLETTGQEAAAAFIPQGTTIAPYDYLVLCVDKDDRADGIDSNNISFLNAWEVQKSVQLDFFKVLDKDFDFLKDVPVQGENYVMLKDVKGSIVDKAEYLSSQVVDYSSLERGDPTEQSDSNDDSEFDRWFLTSDLSGGTPGRVNNNASYIIDGFHNHNINEVWVRNSPALNISDLAYAPKGYTWKRFEFLEGKELELKLSDLSLLVDSLTVTGLFLSPQEHRVSGWSQTYGEKEGFYSNTFGEEGIWRWQNLENGEYFLTISGEFEEAVTVSYKKADGSWQMLAQGIIPNEEGLVYCGIIGIGENSLDGTADNTLEIQLANASQTNTAHFYYLRLDPLQYIIGRININTAPQQVLLSLPSIDEQAASVIINNRPFGNKDLLGRGIGDLFLTDIFGSSADKIDKLGSLSNYITVHSNIFEIIARAQVLEQERVVASQDIKTIIERE
ncbi:MAG: type II secretion system protein GspK [Candidatus Omnitrophica bacterium]|nr:type II secretion system protein GspK [Candidatus Omnitrophota bacterium]MDD5351758.1 type II secretion system protein GspK [Candidatus Omnitrophota bacterium]MDD5550969.1 type II secretion system protein GspK [Candidatus Omnitrophota bacterium]